MFERFRWCESERLRGSASELLARPPVQEDPIAPVRAAPVDAARDAARGAADDSRRARGGARGAYAAL